MRRARVYYKNRDAAELTQLDDGTFVFRYNDNWFKGDDCPPVSLTLPKTKQEYRSAFLFPFFFHMLPEGSNKEFICYHSRIDQKDYFGLLLHTACHDTIGAVRIKKIESIA